MPKKTEVTPRGKLLQIEHQLRAALSDSAQYPQLELHPMQRKRIEDALKLLKEFIE